MQTEWRDQEIILFSTVSFPFSPLLSSLSCSTNAKVKTTVEGQVQKAEKCDTR